MLFFSRMGLSIPPYIVHIEMFIMGKECMEKHGFKVVKGVMNPSSDSYKKSGMLSLFHRNEMCKLSVSNDKHNWIIVDNFEDSNPVTILQRCHDKMIKEYGEVKVMYLCGADAIDSFIEAHSKGKSKFWTFEELKTILDKYGMIIEVNSNRPGNASDPIKILKALNLPTKNVFAVFSTDDISSTTIREAFRNKNYDFLKEIMDENVINYVDSHHLYL